jgi:predicted Zn-dependent peptidase
VQRTEVDGVPVFWQQGPEPLSAGLCFGVGRRDETFATGGVTHLVEHLVMGSLPKSHLDRNASVSPKTTEFTATGRPERVVEFLAQVCATVSDLPTERLATEARVLAVEEERSGGSIIGQLLLLRYGATGHGLMGMLEAGLAGLTEDQARDHAAQWFVRENAALWLTGPPPDGLRLPLRSGSVPARPAQRRLPIDLPAQSRYPGPDPALAFEAAAGEATLCGMRLLVDRLTDRLRHQGGHSYDVDVLAEAVDRDTAHVSVYADAPEAETGVVVEAMVEELQRLVADGPSPEELAHDLEGAREMIADPRSAEGFVGSAVQRHLDGAPPRTPEDMLAQAEAMTPQDVSEALSTALPTLLVLVPDTAPAVLPTVPELPEDSAATVTGRTWRRRLRSDAPRGARMVTSAEGVMLTLGPRRLTVTYDDCVAVGEPSDADHRHLDLVGGGGETLVLCEQDWRDGGALLSEVESAVRGVPRFRSDLAR